MRMNWYGTRHNAMWIPVQSIPVGHCLSKPTKSSDTMTLDWKIGGEDRDQSYPYVMDNPYTVDPICANEVSWPTATQAAELSRVRIQIAHAGKAELGAETRNEAEILNRELVAVLVDEGVTNSAPTRKQAVDSLQGNWRRGRQRH